MWKIVMQAINIVISGPSTVGKSRLILYYIKKYKDLKVVISYTTRTKRKKEVSGIDYHFISDEKFKKMIMEHKFAFYKKSDLGSFYGIAEYDLNNIKQNVGALIDLDVDEYLQLKRSLNNVIGVYLLPRSFEDIKTRLRSRYHLKKNEICEEYEKRLQHSINSIKRAEMYDYIFFNDNIITTGRKIHRIVENYFLQQDREEAIKCISEYDL